MHSVPDKAFLQNPKESKYDVKTSGGITQSKLCGLFEIRLKCSNHTHPLQLRFEETQELPFSEDPLLSVGLLENGGCIVDFINRSLKVGEHVIPIYKNNNMYFIKAFDFNCASAESHAQVISNISKVNNVAKQTVDWQVLPIVFNQDNKRYGPFFVNVFSTNENKITDEFVDDFEGHDPYVGDAFVFHPPYQPDIVERMFVRLNEDFPLSPGSTKYLAFVLYLPKSNFWDHTATWQLLRIIVNEPFATVGKNTGSYGKQGKLVKTFYNQERVFCGDIKFSIAVLYRDILTTPMISPYSLLHLRFSHASHE